MSISREERDAANWSAVLATARDAIVSIDNAGRITVFNPTAEAMFGYTAEEVLGHNVTILMPAPYHDEHDSYLRNYRETGVPKAIGRIRAVEALRKSGEIFPIELSVSESQLSTDVLYTAIIRDVSEKVRLERALRSERDFAERVIDTAQVIILVLDPAGAIVRYNTFMEELCGRSCRSAVGQDWFSTFLPEREWARMRGMFDRAARGVPVAGSVSPIVTAAGDERLIEWHVRLMHGAGAGPLGLLCSGQDVTNQRRAEAEIRTKVRQQAAVALLGLQALTGPDLASLMREAIEKVAETLNVEYVKILELLPGGAALRVIAGTGWQPGVVGGPVITADADSLAGFTLRSSEPTIVGDLGQDTRFKPSLVLRQHNAVSGIGAIIGGRAKPYGILGAYTTESRVFSEDDATFLQTVANVIAESIARERVEAALRETEHAAQQRERLADIGAITAKVVHDLGNPLAALSMQAQLILRRAKRGDFQPREPVQQPAEQILATLQRLESLVREFTDFAREQKLLLTEIDVGAFLREVGDLWRPLAAARSIDLEVTGPAAHVLIRADTEKLKRVFDNLVKNAIEAIDHPPGTVILTAEILATDRIRISVADSGSGIPEDLAVFRLFETTKPAGTGIGLAIAKQLVQAHGGTINHRPRRPHGTIFDVELPQQPGPATLDVPPD